MYKRIAIIGLGGVGGYFGFKLNESNTDKKFNITFVARGITHDIVKASGLTLHSPEHAHTNTRPDSVLQEISALTQQDLILICVKAYDLENVCQQLLDIVTDKTVLLPLMNGVDIYDRIRKVIMDGVVLPSCVYVASHMEEKGVIVHKGNTGKIILGRDPQHLQENIDWVVDMLQNSGANITFRDNPLTEIWTKFIFIASFGLVSARYNKSIGQLCETLLLKERAISIMEEIKAVAERKNVQLPHNIIELTFKKAETFPYHTPTSLQLDVHSGKRENELELFAGAIIRYGIETETDTSNTRAIYAEITEKLRLS
ncbi:ketopantoate reductase family protein [Catalinimonas niigatensis]|uniref:ketopantoate reductase family protein n=1 Tax=Catalinimonas niigatensis TaxID=1397264 RepID=UPI002666FA4F|nr:2-dehydropantoate 2-reductase [Catalinimonas niigatensis]WPP50661.1 2-dehydropantoate 2-reductase [Catalinimonas niigatensis]